MNKHQRAELKKILLAQIDSPLEELRLARLNTALARVDADNFGECFKCELEIPFNILQKHPERVICDSCLEGAKD